MHIVYHQRRPGPEHFSIERVFASVRESLPSNVKNSVSVSPKFCKGLLNRIYNIPFAYKQKGDIHHITGLVHYLAFALPRNKTILTIHDCRHLKDDLKGFRAVMFKFLLYQLPVAKVDLVTTISHFVKNDIVKLINCNPDKIRVVHDPVSNDFSPISFKFNANHPRILQIGTKKPKNLLRVAQALKNISCHLDIIGNISKEQKLILEQCGVEYSYKSNLTSKELKLKYAKSDMVVFASTNEGFGMPIIEANAVGRPVITSDVTSMPEVAGEAACIVNPFEVDSIRNGILKIINDSEYRKNIIAAGAELLGHTALWRMVNFVCHTGLSFCDRSWVFAFGCK